MPKTTVVSKSILFTLDTAFVPWYSSLSDRVADTCEARDLEKLPRELFSLYGGFYVYYKRQTVLDLRTTDCQTNK